MFLDAKGGSMFEKTFGTYGSTRSHPLRVAWRRKGYTDPQTTGILVLFSGVCIVLTIATFIFGVVAYIPNSSLVNSYPWIVSMFVFAGLGSIALLLSENGLYVPYPPGRRRWKFKHTLNEAGKILGVAPEKLFTDHESMKARATDVLVDIVRSIYAMNGRQLFSAEYTSLRDRFNQTYWLMYTLGLADETISRYLELA